MNKEQQWEEIRFTQELPKVFNIIDSKGSVWFDAENGILLVGPYDADNISFCSVLYVLNTNMFIECIKLMNCSKDTLEVSRLPSTRDT